MRLINKKLWITLGLMVILAAGIITVYPTAKDHYIKSKLEPQVELDESLKKMAAVTSYRYSLESGFTVDNRKEVISKVEGEKDNGNTHIKGEMVNTPVDIYYIDRTVYNYDSFSSKWIVIESGSSNSEELLISELNPLSNFRFKQINAVEKVTFETIDGAECLVVMCKPPIESQLLESLWTDFEYRLWLDYKQRVIRKAILNATNKQMSKTKLDINVHMWDFDQPINLEAPDISTKN